MNRYKCIIIDDERYCVENLKEYIDKMPHLKVIGSYTDSIIALTEITSTDKVDFIFLDINMSGINGLDLGRHIRSKTRHLVFTTAHTQHTVEAFSIQASAYLHKPFPFEKFAVIVNNLIANSIEIPPAPTIERFFFIKNISRAATLIKIVTNDIILVEIQEKKLIIYTTVDKHETIITLKEVEKKLLGTGEFTKPNRSFIIATQHIASMEHDMIKMINGKVISIGDSYKAQFYGDLN